MAQEAAATSFVIKDCALAAIAVGRRAQNLRELRDHLLVVHPSCIYHHFWGGLLRPRFDDPEYNNDFASWARHALYDTTLAERLAVIDPAQFRDMEALRQELIDDIEERLDESEFLTWAKRDQQFHFIRSQVVVFDTLLRVEDPREFGGVIPNLSLGSIFYHFIDARRRTDNGVDDFRNWLEPRANCAQLCDRLAALDPYFVTLMELRKQLGDIFTEYAHGVAA